MNRRKLITSMFHRRLLLLLAIAMVVAAALGTQLWKLAVVQGADRLATAERRLNLVTYLPTYRGRILDRRGRVLVADRPGYDVAVHYEVITGAWALKRADQRARSTHRGEWAAMSPEQRESAIGEYLSEYEGQVEEVWAAVMEIGGIDRAELDRRLDAIKKEVQSTAAVVWDRQLRQDIKFGRGPVDEADFRPRPIREQRQPHVLLPRVPIQIAFDFRRVAEQLDGMIVVQDSHRRAYPWMTADVTLDRSTLPRPIRSSEPVTIQVHGVADHILGAIRDDVWAVDMNRRPFIHRVVDPTTGRQIEQIDLGGYRIGDVVGARGLERVFEDHLRGMRGVVRKRLDTGREQRRPHAPGEDLLITLDIALQARIQAILAPEFELTRVAQWQAGWNMDGTPRPNALPRGSPLNSAAVVLDLQSGEILAMVSMPTIAMGQQMSAAGRKQSQPWVNRAVEAIYPPGSTIKPMLLAAAVSQGVHHPDEPIECTGHYFPEREDRARCWIYRPPLYNTHGALLVEEALSRSCNIYFYTLADRLGLEALTSWYRRFDFGQPLDVGLLYLVEDETGTETWRGESGGTVPGEQAVATLRATGEQRFTSVIMGIGQGPVTWTPIQAANAYATLARRGVRRDPSLIRNDPRGGRLLRNPHAIRQREDLHLDERLVKRILEGLRQSVEEFHGTGHHIRYADGTTDPIINVNSVTVWAKTGTAQAPPLRVDTTGDGEPDMSFADLSHAWFVGLVGPRTAGSPQPKFAIAVVVEYGGSGGRTAGPIANEIIRALGAEGYLPEDES